MQLPPLPCPSVNRSETRMDLIETFLNLPILVEALPALVRGLALTFELGFPAFSLARC